MADDADRVLARLAVDAGFLTKDEAMRIWQQCQAPGAPRFIQLLMQSKRLSPADVNQLRALWQRASSGSSPALAPPQNGAHAAPVAVAAPAAPADEGTWEEQLERDTALARVLFSRGLVTQERLRECRALQLQHRVRLGMVLARKGYLDQAAIDDAAASLRAGAAPPASGSCARPSPGAPALGPPPAMGASGRLAAQARPAPAPAAMNPFLPTPSPGGPIDQDAMPTLNVPPGSFPPGSPMTPMTPSGPQDAIPTLLGGGQSVEELNPFAAAPLRPSPGPPAPRGLGPSPPRGDAMLSRDELNAFDDIPLGSPPTAGAASFLPGGSAAEGDITMPPGYAPEGALDAPEPRPPSQPDANLPDSGGEKPAAPKKKKTTIKAAPAPKSNKRLVVMLVVGALLIVVAGVAAVALYLSSK